MKFVKGGGKASKPKPPEKKAHTCTYGCVSLTYEDESSDDEVYELVVSTMFAIENEPAGLVESDGEEDAAADSPRVCHSTNDGEEAAAADSPRT